MKKFTAKLLMVLLLAGFVITPQTGNASGYSEAAAKDYLQNHSQNPWSIMALSAIGDTSSNSDFLKNVSGSSAIDFAAPILAITALGQNPRTFASEDLVSKLKSFDNNSQIGDTSTVNDDIFALLAFVSAGEGASTEATHAKDFLLNHQESNGGWGFAVGGGSDSNMTAASVVALKAAGVSSSDSHLSKALDYLKTAQNNDGGFTYDPTSSFGTDSDSSSTAWVLWALNSLGIDSSSWSKNGNSPKAYLEGQQDPSGWFKYQTNTSPDAFSTTTTAYAVIALAGKTLPVKIITSGSGGGSGGGGGDTNLPFSFRIEGSNSTVCQGKTDAPTALEVVKKAALTCGFDYHIKETSFGPYLDRINDDLASGTKGWLYLVNYNSPFVGAADYFLQNGDSVVWFFNEFDALPTRINNLNSQVTSGDNIDVTVEYYKDNAWKPLEGANVFAGLNTQTTDANGHVLLKLSDGYYKIYAEKTGYVRSNSSLVKVGNVSSNVVNLSTNYQQGTVAGSSIGFTVGPSDVDFGDIRNGNTSEKKITLTNTGSTNIVIESEISGDSIFNQNMLIGDSKVQNFKTPVSGNVSKDVNLKLSVPQSYSSASGVKKAQLTFWASAE